MKKKYRKYFFFYLTWTIIFALIPITIVRPEKLLLEIIFCAFIISAILSLPVTYYFFKSIYRLTIKNENVHFDLLPEEELILKTNAYLKKYFILSFGSLFLTDNRVIFIGAELFNKNKKLINMPLSQITEYKIINNNLIIKDFSCKNYIFLFDGASEFYKRLSTVIT